MFLAKRPHIDEDENVGVKEISNVMNDLDINKNLSALNKSFLKAITGALLKDSTMDLSASLFQQYISYKKEIMDMSQNKHQITAVRIEKDQGKNTSDNKKEEKEFDMKEQNYEQKEEDLAIKTDISLLSGKGEGEEFDQCIYNIRAKLFFYTTQHNNECGWVDLGVGFVKINKSTHNPKSRFIFRNEVSGKTILNCWIDTFFSCSYQEKQRDILLTIPMINEDRTGFLKLSRYLLRARSTDDAIEFVKIIQSIKN